jgi:hypothetical protein
MLRRSLFLFVAAVSAAFAQKYTGPRPPKPDIPYVKHAADLIPTESTEAKEEKGKKDEVVYAIAGLNSPVRTPLASPIFLFQSDKLSPDKLQLFKLESRNGRREIVFGSKKQPQAILMKVMRLDSANLYRIEVDDSLEPGEYSITPQGSNQVFCFQVF